MKIKTRFLKDVSSRQRTVLRLFMNGIKGIGITISEGGPSLQGGCHIFCSFATDIFFHAKNPSQFTPGRLQYLARGLATVALSITFITKVKQDGKCVHGLFFHFFITIQNRHFLPGRASSDTVRVNSL